MVSAEDGERYAAVLRDHPEIVQRLHAGDLSAIEDYFALLGHPVRQRWTRLTDDERTVLLGAFTESNRRAAARSPEVAQWLKDFEERFATREAWENHPTVDEQQLAEQSTPDTEELMRREFEKLADEWDKGLTLEQARALLDERLAVNEPETT